MTKRRQGTWLKFISFFCGIFILSIAFYVNFLLSNDEDARLNLNMRFIAENLENQLNNYINLHLLTLESLAAKNFVPLALWEKEVKDLIVSVPAFKKIEIVDKDFNLIWKSNSQVSANNLNEYFLKYPEFKRLLLSNNSINNIYFSEPQLLKNEGKVFVIFVPRYDANKFQGYLLCYYSIAPFFNKFFKQVQANNYAVSITMAEHLLYFHGDDLNSVNKKFIAKFVVPLKNQVLTVDIYPSLAGLTNMYSYWPTGLLIGGIILALLLARLLYTKALELQAEDAAVQAKKQVEDTSHVIELILEKATEGFISINANGEIIDWNPYATQLFGWEKQEVLGKKLQAVIIPASNQTEYDGKFNLFVDFANDKNISKSMEIIGVRKNQEQFPLELSVFSICINDEFTYHTFLRDISERKSVEKMKNEFISVVSHELRTPLTGIKGSLGLVLGQNYPLPDQARQLLNIAQNNCDRLIRLINDILDIEKIEAGKMILNYAAINIQILVQEAVNANAAYANKFNVKLAIKHNEEAVVFGDYDRLFQVLTNLISNAVKFSHPNQTVSLTVEVNDKLVKIAVEDKGEGIPDDAKDKLFLKFSQVDSSSARSKGGTGLGLSICKSIVELHQGKISFSSKVNEGTTFFVELPLYQKTDVTSKKEDDARPNDVTSKQRILICEDDLECANILKVLLEEHNFIIDIVANAESALAMLKKYNYDLMTLDLMLPGHDGIWLIKELQKQNIVLPIVVISAIAKEGKEKLGSGFSIAGWIDKPFDTIKLDKLLTSTLKNSATKINILHIENDADILNVVKMLLENNANVTGVTTLKEAKEKLKENQYDLVILDLMLPDGKGADLLPIIDWKTKQLIPVIVFSAYDLNNDFSKYISKKLLKSAINNEDLISAIRNAIRKS